MLRALHHVMALEWPYVQDNEALKRAHRIGVHYWRDYYGKVAVREIAAELRRGNLIRAGKAVGELVWYTRGRFLLLPWTFRRRLVRKIQSHVRQARR